MNWHEELPANCPPNDGELPNGRIFYRLCKGNPAESEDFFSQKKENPTRKFAGVSECILRSVSIWNNKNKCLDLKKFKTQKEKVLGTFTLNNDDGLICKTFGQNHYSWWRSDMFDPNNVMITQ